MRVYIHGNCQGPAIAKLIAQQMPNWDVVSYEVHSDKILDEIERYYHYAETADVIVTQPVRDDYRGRPDLSSNWVKEVARPGAVILSYPSMYFDGQLVGTKSLTFPAYGMPYHDVMLVHMVAFHISLDNAILSLNSSDLYPEEFIDNEIKISVEEMSRREESEELDIIFSPFLLCHANSAQLFHVTNHPCRPALAHMAGQIIQYLGYKSNISAVGPELIPYPHIPLPPAVEKILRERGAVNDAWSLNQGEKYHFPSGMLSRREYIEKAYRHLQNIPNSDLMSELRQGPVRAFLNRAATAQIMIPEIDYWNFQGMQ